MKLSYALLESPVSQVFAAVNENGSLAQFYFVGIREVDSLLLKLRRAHELQLCPAALQLVASQIDEYFAHRRTAFELELALEGTTFQKRVWDELCRIPYGTTISYGELAKRVGVPKGARAVGSANGSNPVSLIVPCHRVIGASGTLTGYGGGLPIKQALLSFESGSDLDMHVEPATQASFAFCAAQTSAR